jgi:hypothetical protein
VTSAREDAESRFPEDIAKHQMTIIREDGVYRHLRCAQPGTRNMSFDILTWPGYLAFVGDMGDYVFNRVEDMLTFFRHNKINPGYWAEKVQAQDKDSGIEEYSEDLARAWVKQSLDDGEAPQEVREQADMIDYSNGDARFYDSVDAVGWDGFADHWEANVRDYTYRYIWCCLALVWAVKQYDAAKATHV